MGRLPPGAADHAHQSKLPAAGLPSELGSWLVMHAQGASDFTPPGIPQLQAAVLPAAGDAAAVRQVAQGGHVARVGSLPGPGGPASAAQLPGAEVAAAVAGRHRVCAAAGDLPGSTAWPPLPPLQRLDTPKNVHRQTASPPACGRARTSMTGAAMAPSLASRRGLPPATLQAARDLS